MLIADPPTAIHAEPPEAQPDVIEVIGRRAGETLKIDRRTYQVQQTPHSAQKDAVQLLRGLPAVTITPDNQILLLGSGNAKIYIDGRPYPGDSRQYLRTLHGSDIERIEVITNPSAQFSAEGTGGIINFVMRIKTGQGISGNASVEGSSYRRGTLDSTINYKKDKWTYEIKAGGNVGALTRSTFHRQRSVASTPSGPETVSVEDGKSAYQSRVGRLSGKATYDFDSKTSISASLGGGGGHDTVVNDAEFRGLTPDFASFSERRRLNSVGSYVNAELNLDHKGAKEGETLNVSTQFYGNPQYRDLATSQFSDGSSYRSLLQKPSFVSHTQLAWKRPMGKGQILSLGGSWHIDGTSQKYRFSSTDGDGALGPDTADQFDARSSTLAGYVTFQQALGDLTLVPGFRTEHNSRRISSPGLPDIRINRTDMFPTIHLKYPLSNRLELTASYSKRIDRVPLQNLRPYGTVEDTITIFQGNPELKDQSIDAYEVNLQYRVGKLEAGVIVYLRETSQLWSKSYSVTPSGVSIYTFVNSGRSRDSGAQFDFSIPVLRRVKANLSLNLFDQWSPVDTPSGRQNQSTFRYSTNGTLQWNGADRGDVPGDVAQFQWTYNSPAREFQLREYSWYNLSLSYTHSFSRTLSLSGTFYYPGRSRKRLRAPLIQDAYSLERSPEFRIKLLKTF